MPAAPVIPGTDSGIEEHELSRITVMIGKRQFDFGLPRNVAVSVLADEVIEIAKNHLGGAPAEEYGDTDQEWTFARVLGDALDPSHSLAEAGVRDGELLLIRSVECSLPDPMVDELVDRGQSTANKMWLWRTHGWNGVLLALATVLSVAAALLVPRLADTLRVGEFPSAAVTAVILGVLAIVGSYVVPQRSGSAGRSAWTAAVGLPLLFVGSLYVVPDAHGFDAIPMAAALVGLMALTHLVVGGTARSFYTAVTALALFCIAAATCAIVIDPNPRVIGAALAVAALLVVHRAPKWVIALSRLPVPNVPTAGEPLDDIEVQGGTSVEGVAALGNVVPTEEGMAQRVRRASQYLTGILIAASGVAAIGCYIAADVTEGFYWQGIVFGFAVSTALCLRGRSHHDLIQAAVLIGSGLVTASAVIMKLGFFVDGWHVEAALLLIALIVIVLMCGLVAPTIRFSPVARRSAEIGEYVALAAVLPLACWIFGVYAYFRGLQL